MKIRTAVLGAVMALGAAAVNASQGELQAQIRWTRFGVPHVKADNYESLGFGYGYAVAPHRLCLLADRILTLRGERSRWFGPDAPVVAGFLPTTNLNADLFHRVHLSDEDVTAATATLSADARAIASGYALGFNRYVNELTEQQRAEACQGAPIPKMVQSDVVRAVMSIGVLWKSFQVMPFAASSAWGEPAPKQASAVVMDRPPPAIGIGSNVWAYGADATGTGSAILLGNPHCYWRDNWLNMHQLHLTIPGEIDVAGADFAGLPLPVAGFNHDVAWSVEAPSTVTYYVMQLMQVQAGAEPSYVIDGQRKPLRIAPVVLEIKQSDGSIARREFPIAWSELGALYQLPAMPGRPAGWYAVTDAQAGNALGLDQLLAVARARSTAELRDGVVRYRGVGSHFIAGDRHGDALYVEAGPILDIDTATLERCAVKDAKFNVFDGSRADCAIRDSDRKPRLAAADKQPAVITRGIVQNLNNSYHLSVHGQTLQGYSPMLGSPGNDLRLPMSDRRMREISSDGKVTPEEALAVIFDNRNYAAESWLDAILKTCKPEGLKAEVRRACGILARWDKKNDATSRGALLFHVLWPRLEKIPGLLSAASEEKPLAPRAVELTEQRATQVIAAIEQTVAELASHELVGDEPWGNILSARTPGGRVPLHGGSHDEGVLNVLRGAGLGHEGYEAIVSGASYIQRVRWEGGRVLAEVVLAHSQSADPRSPNATDQLENFANKRLLKTPFTEEEIRKDSDYRTVTLRQPR